YRTMQTHGCTKKLVIRGGRIASLVNSPSGETVIENAEVTEIVDSFIEKHPDFSFRGARGLLALTGYNGVFGYKTHDLKSPAYASEKAHAVQIAALLKKNGWEFASHGYRHLRESKVTPEKLDSDARRWKNEVEPIVGATPHHVYPFGSIIRPGKPGLDVLLKYGFTYYYGVEFVSKIKEHGNWISCDRIPIDGKYVMGRVSGSRTSQFCNIKKVVDPKRNLYFKGKQVAAGI
ncbi:MAG: polysaccharide deacetylase family protein, partial [Spirochaetota bacterium]